jgi:hypothetical protein
MEISRTSSGSADLSGPMAAAPVSMVFLGYLLVLALCTHGFVADWIYDVESKSQTV